MPEPSQDMSTRTMLVLGGIMTVGVAAVLGMTTLTGRLGGAENEPPARPATVTRQSGAAVETVAPEGARPAPVRRGGITAHVAVPPTQGLDQQTARVRLRATRLVVSGVLRVPSDLPAGQVVRTSPPTGTGVQVGDKVTISVSNATPAGAQATVPFQRGLSLAPARAAAAKLGLTVVVTRGKGTVTAQTPAPGSVMPRGSEIAVVLE
jgi:hypothetical protein